MKTLIRTWIAIECALLMGPSLALAQYSDQLPTPNLSLKQLMEADKIVYGTIKSFEAGKKAGTLRANLQVGRPEAFLKGRPEPWPTSGEVVLDLVLPTPVLLEKGEQVLWFLKQMPNGLEIMGSSGWFAISGDQERPLAHNINWNHKLWNGSGELWKITGKTGSRFRFDVEARIQKKLLEPKPETPPWYALELTAMLWIDLGSEEKPRSKLPLILLVSIIETYLSYLDPT